MKLDRQAGNQEQRNEGGEGEKNEMDETDTVLTGLPQGSYRPGCILDDAVSMAAVFLVLSFSRTSCKYPKYPWMSATATQTHQDSASRILVIILQGHVCISFRNIICRKQDSAEPNRA